jgi:hypothetical protein
VRVSLLRCQDDQPTADDDDDDGASFNYVRLETAFDAIFATTNSFCPLREGHAAEDASVHAKSPEGEPNAKEDEQR